MVFQDRYARNSESISILENVVLKSKYACVLGLGGLGGYASELLARVGVGHITILDSDTFETSNLNRQLFSTELNIGKSKAQVAKERLQIVNSEIEIIVHEERFTEDNAYKILTGQDIVIDALDNVCSRRIALNACQKLCIPFVHGAIAGFYGQVSVIMPFDSTTFETLYPTAEDKGIEQCLGNPSFTPAIVAAMEVSEAIKILLGKGQSLASKVLTLDLLNNNYMVLELN